VTQIISELDQLGLVSTDVVSQGRYGRSQKIKITVPLATVKDALKDDPIFAEIID
jgi:cell division control protein 6